jgi:hypothetical protein
LIHNVIDGCIVENPEIDKIITYLRCAKEFGWTPEETNKIDIVLLKDILTGLDRIKQREIQDMKNG